MLRIAIDRRHGYEGVLLVLRGSRWRVFRAKSAVRSSLFLIPQRVPNVLLDYEPPPPLVPFRNGSFTNVGGQFFFPLSVGILQNSKTRETTALCCPCWLPVRFAWQPTPLYFVHSLQSDWRDREPPVFRLQLLLLSVLTKNTPLKQARVDKSRRGGVAADVKAGKQS